MDKKDESERLAELIEALKPRLRELVEEVLAEKLRLDPHALDWAGTAGKDRQTFLDRSTKK